jgi:hypothetical protein
MATRIFRYGTYWVERPVSTLSSKTLIDVRSKLICNGFPQSSMKCEALPWAFKNIVFPVRKGLSTCDIYWRNRKLCYFVVFSALENFAIHELKDASTCKSWACTPPPWSFECKSPSGTWRMISMPVLPLPNPATLVTSYNHNLEMFIAICNWAVDLAIGDTGTLKVIT